MTAREQAREAAANHVYDVMQHGGYTGPEPAADAASDVWEPLLRESVEHLRVWLPHHLRDAPMMRRMDEALGNGRNDHA